MKKMTRVTIEFEISGRSIVSRRALVGGLAMWIHKAVEGANQTAAKPGHVRAIGKTEIKDWRLAGVQEVEA